MAADWLLPISSGPIRDGAVVVDGDRIDWFGRLGELPDAAARLPVHRVAGVMTPGLVNAHTHLQYTHFDAVGRQAHASFEDWSHVFGEVYDAIDDPDSWRRAALDGAGRAVRSGTTVLAEIITNDEARGALDAVGATGIEYIEAIGLFERVWTGGGRDEYLTRLHASGRVPCGVSPHAPYSLDGAVIRDLVAIAAERGMRLHSHLAESAVEANLYGYGDKSVLSAYGDLRDEFELVRIGGLGHTTAQYADSVGLLTPDTHVAHAIYLDRAGRDLLLERRTQVALCPRSNAVIGLDVPQVAAYLEEGHEIAVGTDSLASCPSLDLMEDVAALATIARSQGYENADLSERLMRAATLGGALAMGLAHEGYGAVSAGGPADLAVFDVPVRDGDVYGTLVERAAGRCVLTVSDGRTLHRAATAPVPPRGPFAGR